MQSNQVRSVTVQNNKNTNYISNITQGHTYGKKRRNKNNNNKMCNEIKKCKTIRCAKNNKMCKRQWDVQKTMRCAKKQQDVQKNNKMYKKRKQKTVYWDLINSNVNKRDVQTLAIFISSADSICSLFVFIVGYFCFSVLKNLTKN